MNDIKLKIGQIMLDLRKSQKKSQAEVAEYLKLTVAAYQNYEAGRREAGYDTICKLADFYGVSTDYLLGHSDEKPDPIEQIMEAEEREKKLLKAYFTLPDKLRASFLDGIADALQEQYHIESTEINTKAVARSEDGSETHFSVSADSLSSAEEADDL
ncbi:helix-turn-helix transcriptional regulator [Ruminococcus sp.]|uniref:helix-turn-helix domain-containing protein n=1 Tax=Ruminococcus sp. TaxID=41978 RepID=UPI0025CDBBCF|nr:helix-turn-helix transcriptional regulator [Ruminococcus sp.]